MVCGLESLTMNEHLIHTPTVSLRSATHHDAKCIFNWQTHPSTRLYFRHANPPAWEEHVQWLNKRLSSDRSIISIIMYDGQPVGLIRLDIPESSQQNNTYVISILLDPNHKQKGFARQALKMLFVERPHTEFIAEIHKDNSASIKLFEQSGFTVTDHITSSPWLTYRKEYNNV